MANSKYYNPHTFDPQRLDYQKDIRLAVRDEIATDPDATEVYESLYFYFFMTEVTWPSIFFSTWAAFEPDVRTI